MAATSKKATAKQAASTKKASNTKSSTTRAAAPAKKAPAKKAPAAKAPATKAPATKAAATKAPAKAPAKKAPAKKAPAKAPAKKAPAKKAPATKAPATKAPATKAPAKRPPTTTKSTTTKMASTPKSAADPGVSELPKPRFNKDGFGYTKDFDLAFVKEMHDMLQEERVRLTGQAKRLEDEAHQLVEEAEMGDVQFDDEGGEGDTMVVERERDLALSAQARETVVEIDAALDRIKIGTYGYSVVSGRPLPKERLEAIPWASVLVEEKVGGIGRDERCATRRAWLGARWPRPS
jgi:RNA polymerase-binding transcription factor DksA